MNILLRLILLSIVLILFSNLGFAQETKTSFLFSVLDENNNFLTDLKSSDIKIRQNKNLFEIDAIKQNTNQNLDIVFMIDTSVSQERVLPLVKKIAQSFVSKTLRNDNDRVSITGFAGDLKIYQALTGDLAAANQKINQVEIKFPKGYVGGGIVVGPPPPLNSNDARKGSTSIWDSVKDVSQTILAVEKKDSRKAIILISDGVDTFSKGRMKGAVEESLKNKIPVYAIGIGDKNYDGVDEKSLKAITDNTGGKAFFPKNTDELPKIFKEIEQSLRSNYEVTFNPDFSKSNNDIQEFKVEVVNPELGKRKFQIIQPAGIYFSN